MQIHSSRTIQSILIFIILLVGCNPYPGNSGSVEKMPVQESTQGISSSDHPLSISTTAPQLKIWESSILPETVKTGIQITNPNKLVKNPQDADIKIDFEIGGDDVFQISSIQWIYALVTPFSTNVDNMTIAALRQAWRGRTMGVLENKPLFLSEETLVLFQHLWGKPGKNAVKVLPEGEILDAAWNDQPAWAIIPFSDLEPKWKVIRISGKSPLDDVIEKYPLTVHFAVTARDDSFNLEKLTQMGIIIPKTNREREKLTILVMTGTTALVRHTALRMEEEGVTYPGDAIGDWLSSADLTHISNEVSFWSKCPPAKPLRLEMRFCSDPRYLELLNDVGMDIMELTGNHLQDWGNEPLLETLDIYQKHNIPYYGGGRNLKEAQEPLLIENHGNRLAFLGCNAAGPKDYWATDKQPGPAPCELDDMIKEIKQLKSDGYIPIVTFQHIEVEDYKPHSSQRIDFNRVATEAGPAIVSGSQSHSPQAMTFIGDTFVHYGLGNLFFDQMTEYNRREFIDRHYFYNGKYIGTELLTAMLEDYSQPRPMTDDEHYQFLEEIFKACVW